MDLRTVTELFTLRFVRHLTAGGVFGLSVFRIQFETLISDQVSINLISGKHLGIFLSGRIKELTI